MSFKEIIRLISERHTDMTEVTDALSDMMHTVKDRLPEVYRETMYCLEEIAYRITPEEARQIVKGMRPYGQKWDYDTIKAFLATFQSTPPVRGATPNFIDTAIQKSISIHAPRAGGDIPQTMSGMSPAIFQSTPPVRGATLT